MALTQPSVPDRRPSPGLSLDLPSNNPFRNRAASPGAPSPALSAPNSAPLQRSPRPVSRNPFLAAFEDDFTAQPPQPQPTMGTLVDLGSDERRAPPEPSRASKPTTFGSAAEELFKDLSLNDKSERSESDPRQRPSNHRSGTMPNGHRPARSGDDRRERDRRDHSSRGAPRPRDRYAHDSPERRERRRPRRNSESSVLDRDEERRLREKRREREGKTKDGKSRKTRPNAQVDLIDKLDVTGIYGPGLFHHDGPFDACNPHRNRKKDHRAPMQAFPAGSANNALGGAGPLNKNIDLDQFHGRTVEGFTDYNVANNRDDGRAPQFNPKGTIEPVHGDESAGLGTSTFLEGAPASKTAMQRRESENEMNFQSGGLQRKKSLAQRIRGISQPRRGFQDGNQRIVSPHTRYGPASPSSPSGHHGASASTSKMNEVNPFDEYDEAYDKKGQTIRIAETEKEVGYGRRRAPSSPPARLERTRTSDSYGVEEPVKPTGFLNRVKSLKRPTNRRGS